MKSKRSPIAQSLLSSLLLAGVVLPVTSLAQDAAKTYTLFMGSNVSINLDKDLYPVRDINGSAWVVNIGGQDRAISGKEAQVDLKITSAQKLTEQSAVISDFKHEPGYSFANDPAVKLTRSLNQAADANAGSLAAANQASALNIVAISAPQTGPNAVAGNGGNGTGDGTQNVFSSNPAAAADAATADAALAGGGQQATSEGYDALNVQFEISSPKEIPTPYLVAMARFHPKGSAPGVVQSLVYAKALEAIGPTPTKVKFAEEGFPFDYEMIDYQVHIYNRGVEIATNIAEKREEMTPDEAFAYVKNAYLESHKSATLPATPILADDLPADLSARLAAGDYSKPVFVKVSKEGLSDGAFSDSACTQKIDDPYLQSVVRDIRFKPALADGKPVEGVAPVSLDRLKS